MQQRHGSHLTAPLLAVLLLMSIPAGAASPKAAESLHASARAYSGENLAVAGTDVITTYYGFGAHVTMPPQVEAAVVENRGVSTSAVDEPLIVMSHWREVADGDLAAGTAFASTRNEHLEIHLGGTTITATGVRSFARASCAETLTAEQASAGTAVASLAVGEDTVTLAPGERHEVQLPDGVGVIELQTAMVAPAEDGTGWTTTALVVRYGSAMATAAPVSLPISGEMRFGRSIAQVDCAA
jgi:hypothetical protein